MSQTERWVIQTSSLAARIKRCVTVREWAWWQLPWALKTYVAAMVVTAVAAVGVLAAYTDWHAIEAAKFAILVVCCVISIASTPRAAYAKTGSTSDFSGVWLLPTAILLPPVYVALMSIPLVLTLYYFVHRGVVYRRVFTAAVIGLGYVLASLTFRWFPASFAGSRVGFDTHAFTWMIAVTLCEIIGSRTHHFLIMFAVKLTDRNVKILETERDRETLQALFVEIDLGVLITIALDLSTALVVVALPTVFLVRRFIIYPILVAQSKVDSKTGLLNISAWEEEAEAELSRSVRNRHPAAVALVDIDHFKVVNDTYGHLVGDRVLKAIADSLTSQSRDYDRVGRFGGEEFVLLLAQTTERDACKIAERLRGYIESLAIPIDDRTDAPTVKVTISVGVTAMAGAEKFELIDLLAASDSAMYAAKQAGRNRVAFARPLHDMGLGAAWTHNADGKPAVSASSTHRASPTPERSSAPSGVGAGASKTAGTPPAGSSLTGHHVVLVQADQTAASLCPLR